MKEAHKRKREKEKKAEEREYGMKNNSAKRVNHTDERRIKKEN